MKKWFLFFFLASYGASGQKTTLKKIELNGDKIIVYYDLEDNNPNNEYQIQLYTSKDKFNTPVSKVKGDIGSEIKPGTNKRVEWNIIEEFGSYFGDLELEIRGKVYVPFVKIQSFLESKSAKRGKSYDLIWRPGNTNPVHIELYKGSQRMQGDLNQPNNGKYTMNFGPHLKPGDGYKVKITDSKKTADFVYTNEFKVRRKIPLVVKVVPVVAIGALIVILGNAPSKIEEIPGPDWPPPN